MKDVITISYDGPERSVAVVTIDHPPANSLNGSVLEGLDACAARLEEDGDVRAVVLTGAGGLFAAGADVAEFTTWSLEELEARERMGQAVLSRWAALPVPTIAALDGFALGGGLELALACDFRVASERAKLGLPEVSLGVVPAYGGISRLTRLIGEGHAKRLIFTGEAISARTALVYGLVQEVTAPEELMPCAMKLARRIAAMAPLAVSGAKACLKSDRERSLRQGLEEDAACFTACFQTADAKEGIDAFLSKRKARFIKQ